MRAIGRGVAVVLVAAPCAAALCVAAATGVHAEEEGEEVAVSIRGNTPLEDVLTLVRSTLGHRLVWDPRSKAIQGQVVLGGLELRGSRAEVLQALRGALTFYELGVVTVGEGENALHLVLDVRATHAIVRLKPEFVALHADNVAEYAAKDGLFVAAAIRVENLESLREARAALARLVTPQIGNVAEVPGARTFLVTDFAPSVVAIWRLVREMDAAAPPRGASQGVFRAVPLRHADAKDVAATLAAHFPPDAAGHVPHPQPQGVPEGPPRPPLRITPDARTNQILVSGRREDVDRVLEVVRTIDEPLPRPEVAVHAMTLGHVGAPTVARLLDGLIQGAPATWSHGARGGERPSVLALAETNTLLVQGTAAHVERIRRIVAELDVPTPGEGRPGAR
jgi:type II secretory pathway component GspD/PulD (secretin)